MEIYKGDFNNFNILSKLYMKKKNIYENYKVKHS